MKANCLVIIVFLFSCSSSKSLKYLPSSNVKVSQEGMLSEEASDSIKITCARLKEVVDFESKNKVIIENLELLSCLIDQGFDGVKYSESILVEIIKSKKNKADFILEFHRTDIKIRFRGEKIFKLILLGNLISFDCDDSYMGEGKVDYCKATSFLNLCTEMIESINGTTMETYLKNQFSDNSFKKMLVSEGDDCQCLLQKIKFRILVDALDKQLIELKGYGKN